MDIPDRNTQPDAACGCKQHPTTYLIYLLTVWVDEAGNADSPQKWRFRLENPKAQEKRGFVGIEALLEGLVKMVGESEEFEEDGGTDE